jgi:hypothetical protein
MERGDARKHSARLGEMGAFRGPLTHRLSRQIQKDLTPRPADSAGERFNKAMGIIVGGPILGAALAVTSAWDKLIAIGQSLARDVKPIR